MWLYLVGKCEMEGEGRWNGFLPDAYVAFNPFSSIKRSSGHELPIGDRGKSVTDLVELHEMQFHARWYRAGEMTTHRTEMAVTVKPIAALLVGRT